MGVQYFQTKPFLLGIKLLVLLTSLGTPFNVTTCSVWPQVQAAGLGVAMMMPGRAWDLPGVTRPTRPTRQLVGGTTHLGKISDLLLDWLALRPYDNIFRVSAKKGRATTLESPTHSAIDTWKILKVTKIIGYQLHPATRSSARDTGSTVLAMGWSLGQDGAPTWLPCSHRIRVTFGDQNLGTLISITIAVQWMFVEFSLRASDILDWSLVSSLLAFFHCESGEQLIFAMLVLLGPQLK